MRGFYMAATGLVCGVALAGAAAPARAGTFTVLHEFQGGTGDGASPSGSLIDAGGTLYGNSFWGGAANCPYGGVGCGTVYSINPATGAETIVHVFTDAVKDGARPRANLIKVGKKLFGTGDDGAGIGSTVFSVNPMTGAAKVIYLAPSEAGYPGALSALLNIGGTLYGTSIEGGTSNLGTVFAVNHKTGAESAVYSFQGGSDGANPAASLINVGGLLYGTAEYGGGSTKCDSGCGVVFSVDPATGAEQIVHAFKGSQHDGSAPMANMIEVGGLLYGTTSSGGGHAFGGTVFSLDPTTGKETIIYAFQGGGDGYRPTGGLIDVGGTLYGTTQYGGGAKACEAGCGTLFAVDLSSGSETVLHAFQFTDGSVPGSALVDVNGSLYGTAPLGGDTQVYDQGYGTVFEYTP